MIKFKPGDLIKISCGAIVDRYGKYISPWPKSESMTTALIVAGPHVKPRSWRWWADAPPHVFTVIADGELCFFLNVNAAEVIA